MRIGIATSGLWHLRGEVELMTGGTACRLPPGGFGVDAIAGWGHKPTANRARAFARSRGIPYIAFEDGFLRSVNPGNGERPLSMVMDRTGIYYDARQPSDLEALIRKRAASPQCDYSARLAIELLRTTRVSKYNNSTLHDIADLGLKTSRQEDRVLVIDQTRGDASIEGAFANSSTFPKMLEAAVTENPGAEILVRIHPETMMGRRAGHFSPEALVYLATFNPAVAKASDAGFLRLTPEPVNPWVLLEGCSKVYCVSSQMGFEALMAGCEVHAFGKGFYHNVMGVQARFKHTLKEAERFELEAVVSAFYFDYMSYLFGCTGLESFEIALKFLYTAIGDDS